MTEPPMIISVDDHVVEPPDLWSSRLPARYQDRGPRIKRQKMKMLGGAEGGAGSGLRWTETPEGEWSDVWYYDDLVSPLMMVSAAVGFEELGFGLTTFDEIRKGTWDQAARLADMDANHVEAAIASPTRCPASAGRPSSSARTRSSPSCACRPTTTG